MAAEEAKPAGHEGSGPTPAVAVVPLCRAEAELRETDVGGAKRGGLRDTEEVDKGDEDDGVPKEIERVQGRLKPLGKKPLPSGFWGEV